MKQFSTEDLISFLYKESPDQNSLAISHAIEQSWTLREKLTVLEESMQVLQAGWQHPRRAVVDRILQYAKAGKKVIPA